MKWIICSLSFCCASLLALPQEPSLEAGDAHIQIKENRIMEIQTSEKAIVNYQSFNVAKGEKVQFIQPSSSSYVLNRVKGKEASAILGSIESNGNVFLVNPNGIYFGRDSVVNVVSLVASTLQIASENFLKENFSFSLEDKKVRSEICNEGVLVARGHGSIVLLAPIIRNAGVIQAHLGKVVLASGEQVTLDFEGDGLLGFSVEGAIQDAVIEHLGMIQAPEGDVFLRAATAKKVILDLINASEIEPGEVFVMEEGEICLVSASSILAKNIEVKASHVEVCGEVESPGGRITLGGAVIDMRGAYLDVSGTVGGGTILVGGGYKGMGPLPYAETVDVDQNTALLANGTGETNGGLIVLWSWGETSFQGSIEAKGGGLVETSSLGRLIVSEGRVDTTAPSGGVGTWLLDPTTLTIASTGPDTPSGCSSEDSVIAVTTIETAASTVILCANTIIQQVPITMTVAGAGLTFQTPPGAAEGLLQLDGGDILTQGGAVLVENLRAILGVSLQVDTTVGSSVGADILFGQVDADGGGESLTLLAGYSSITLGNIGDESPLGGITIMSSDIKMQDLITESGPIQVLGSISLLNDVLVDSTKGGGGGANITLGRVNGLSSLSQSLTIAAGTAGIVTLGAIGENSMPESLTITSANVVFFQNILAQGSVLIQAPIKLINATHEIQNFASVFGDEITIASVEGSISQRESLLIIADINTPVSIGPIGVTNPINQLFINSEQSVSLQEIQASSLEIASGQGVVYFNEDVELLGLAGGQVSAGIIEISGEISAESLALSALGPILSTGANQNLVTNTGALILNSSRGSLGSFVSPLGVDPSGPFIIGASQLAVLIGPITASSIQYIPKHQPCVVSLNGVILSNCNAIVPILPIMTRGFLAFQLTPQKLGIGYNSLSYNNHWLFSQFTQFVDLSAGEVEETPVGF